MKILGSGSGLAIGGAASAVVVAGAAIYFGVIKETPPDPVTEPAAQTQPAPEVVAPETKVAIAEPKTAPVREPPKVNLPPTPPSIDLVRVDKAGSTVVAGKAAANTTVLILLDGKVVAETTTDATGAFVVLFDLEPSDRPRELSLVEKPASGDQVASVDKVLVMPFKPDATAAPKLVVAKADTVEVIAPAEPANGAEPDTEQPEATDVATTQPELAQTATAEPVQQTDAPTPQVASSEGLSLDTILYDDLGGVIITGSGNRDDYVRIYLDNKPADIQKVSDDGQWKITLADIPDGLYDLRVDSIDSLGVVTERVESPFKREAVGLITAVNRTTPIITIQPGYTLWALAELRYGSGNRYMQIYEANRDRIKDPNLIYPGQLFDLPN